MELSNCYYYFAIKGIFNPCEITITLQVEPTKYWAIGDCRGNGSRYDFAFWETGYSRIEYPDVIVPCNTAIQELIGKEDLLRKIKEDNDVCFVFEIVPTIYYGVAPVIDLDKELIKFCHLTDTDIDIDMYIFPYNDDEKTVNY